MIGRIHEVDEETNTFTVAACFAAIFFWGLIHLANWQIFIFHDSWKYNFPIQYAIAMQAGCGEIPYWLGSIDHGSPALIYVVSFSLTQLLRIPELALLSCMRPGIGAAVLAHKLWLFVGYLIFAVGMYFAGRTILRSRVSAAYLCIASLYAGACLDMLHSDQILSLLFWCPWMVAAIGSGQNVAADHWWRTGRWIAATGFFLVTLLDQAPHLYAVPAAIGLIAYVYAVGCRHSMGPPLKHAVLAAGILTALTVATVIQLLAIKAEIEPFTPSLRSSLIIDPLMLGSQAFVQPTALLNHFFPLGVLAEFEILQRSSPVFIFHLDNLVFVLGAIPTLLFIAYFVNPSVPRRQKMAWGAAVSLILLVSLQQSKLYLLLFHLPFFNIFRSYFLYIVFVIFAALLVSALGLDSLISQTEEARSRISRRTVICALILAIVALGVMVFYGSKIESGAIKSRIAFFTAVDIVMFAIATACFWRVAQKGRAVYVIVALILLNSAYFLAAYRLTGMQFVELLTLYGAAGGPKTRIKIGDSVPGNEFRRQPCNEFAECYVRGTLVSSEKLGGSGTFLRHKDEPVFVEGLAPEVRRAFMGIDHPVFWISAPHPVVLGSRRQLIDWYNQRVEDLPRALASSTSYIGAHQGVDESADVSATIETVSLLSDGFRLNYHADRPGVLNASIARSDKWLVTVNGKEVAYQDANLSGIAFPVPGGAGEVRLRYADEKTTFFLILRGICLCAALALLAAVCLMRRRRG